MERFGDAEVLVAGSEPIAEGVPVAGAKVVTVEYPSGSAGKITEARWTSNGGKLIALPDEGKKVDDAHVYHPSNPPA